jgi:hypothetical protein
MHPIPDALALVGVVLFIFGLYGKSKQRGHQWLSISKLNVSADAWNGNSILTPSETGSSTPQPTQHSAARAGS